MARLVRRRPHTATYVGSNPVSAITPHLLTREGNQAFNLEIRVRAPLGWLWNGRFLIYEHRWSGGMVWNGRFQCWNMRGEPLWNLWAVGRRGRGIRLKPGLGSFNSNTVRLCEQGPVWLAWPQKGSFLTLSIMCAWSGTHLDCNSLW